MGGEREKCVEERENLNKIMLNIFKISIHTMPIVERYYNKCQIYLAFGIFDVGGFLVFDMLYVNDLLFRTKIFRPGPFNEP